MAMATSLKVDGLPFLQDGLRTCTRSHTKGYAHRDVLIQHPAPHCPKFEKNNKGGQFFGVQVRNVWEKVGEVKLWPMLKTVTLNTKIK